MRPREFFKVQCTVLQPQSKVVKGHNNINCMLGTPITSQEVIYRKSIFAITSKEVISNM